jgi:DNA-binding MarR family transcriptional regulator
MSEAAAVISATPATATYHVQQLENMGLVQRGRSGKEVTVSRTERGHELITLMGRDP